MTRTTKVTTGPGEADAPTHSRSCNIARSQPVAAPTRSSPSLLAAELLSGLLGALPAMQGSETGVVHLGRHHHKR